MKRWADRIASAPKYDCRTISSPVWIEKRSVIVDLLKAGRDLSRAQEIIGDKATESANENDLTKARAEIRRYGRSIFRVFRRSYRTAMAEFAECLTGPPPKSFSDRVRLADSLVTARKARDWLKSAAPLAETALGSLWRRESTDWAAVEALVHWINQNDQIVPSSFYASCSLIEDQRELSSSLQKAEEFCSSVATELNDISTFLELDFVEALGAPFRNIDFDVLRSRLASWVNRIEDLSKWIAYRNRTVVARQLGIADVVERLDDGRLAPGIALDAFQKAYFEAMLRHVIEKFPSIGRFDGHLHDQKIASFRQSDLARIDLARGEVRSAHHEGIRRKAITTKEILVVKGEIAKKRAHMPIRKLIRVAGRTIQAIKPVFMMSPLSIAQFIEPGALEFDLVVIDEASQVEPVSALGAIARGKQIVVVGDEKQLPPTRFFQRLADDGDGGNDDGDSIAGVTQIESILGLCIARGVPQTMLRWHYRSQHHSLIAVSNHEFYDNSLFVVPSPWVTGIDFGLKFIHISKGVFDRGGNATNSVEAKEIAQAIARHARENADKTLGVVAFSIRQKQAILDELELLREQNISELEDFIGAHPDEPFFVKNLENIQGDERDVIFVSVGYGRDANGYMSMYFGPVSQEGGERRLNVLISRAKIRCEVFSSIMAEDIDLDRGRGRGVAALKTFLNFARTGRLDTVTSTYGDAQSPFEEAVRRALEREGYDVRSQVGSKGFFIDLAIKDPQLPGRFLLGIECDGAAYHSSRSARDRDRLRQAVLEQNGWTIHRIWSTDWYQRPEEQLRRTVQAIETERSRFSLSNQVGVPTVSA